MYENPNFKLKVTKKDGEGIHNYKREIKVRKDHFCINCQSIIKKGEIVLVHHWHEGLFTSREYYCNKCYEIVDT